MTTGDIICRWCGLYNGNHTTACPITVATAIISSYSSNYGSSGIGPAWFDVDKDVRGVTYRNRALALVRQLRKVRGYWRNWLDRAMNWQAGLEKKLYAVEKRRDEYHAERDALAAQLAQAREERDSLLERVDDLESSVRGLRSSTGLYNK